MIYKVEDLVQTRGHIYTRDELYYLKKDGMFNYWCEIMHKDGDILKLSHTLGSYSYDYCFRNNLVNCVAKLNKLLAR